MRTRKITRNGAALRQLSTLPARARPGEEGKVEARFDNGVLKVTLPKRAEGAQHKIEIKKS